MRITAPDARSTLRRLATEPGFRRLLAARFAAQWGDGLFQVALGGAVLFNPERQADPFAIAAGLAVLLLPYSLVGPFAGALLDRWDRRRLLIGANLLRGLLILVVAAAVGTGLAGVPLYAGALLVTGVSRFVLAGLSTSLPHVVADRDLVTANSVGATLGAVVAILGSGTAIGVRAVAGAGNVGSAIVTATAVVGSVLAAVAAVGFGHGVLGPDRTGDRVSTVGAVAGGWRDGFAAAVRVRSVAAGMLALAAHRVSFGIGTLVMLLLFRHTFEPIGPLRAGLAGVGQMLAAGGAGALLAAVLTPPLTRRFGRRITVRGALVVAAAVLLALGVPMTLPSVLGAAFGLACAGQVVKLSLDAAVQLEIGDDVRGRVFACYDVVFNVGYVVAVALAAVAVPLDGRAPGLLVVAACGYLVAAVAHTVIDSPHRSKPGSPAR